MRLNGRGWWPWNEWAAVGKLASVCQRLPTCQRDRRGKVGKSGFRPAFSMPMSRWQRFANLQKPCNGKGSMAAFMTLDLVRWQGLANVGKCLPTKNRAKKAENRGKPSNGVGSRAFCMPMSRWQGFENLPTLATLAAVGKRLPTCQNPAMARVLRPFLC